LTAVENAAVPLLIHGENRRAAFAKSRAMLDRLGLSSRADALPAQLSGGQQQRVAIARALIHDPRIVVCDEPTSALDHDTGVKIMEIFRSIVLEDSRTLVVVTHDSRIFGFADRIARMDDGRIVEVKDNPPNGLGQDQ
jgi:putative ABC transport system ATP-binding protein